MRRRPSVDVATLLLYSLGYQHPQTSPAFGRTASPVSSALYFLTYLGGHLNVTSTNTPLWSCLIGTALLLAFVLAVSYIVRHRNEALLGSRSLPWIAIGLYALLTEALATLARAGFGTRQALASRHTTLSLYLTLSVLGCLGAICSTAAVRAFLKHRLYPRIMLSLLAGAFLVTALLSCSRGIRLIRYFRMQRLEGKAALLALQVWIVEGFAKRVRMLMAPISPDMPMV